MDGSDDEDFELNDFEDDQPIEDELVDDEDQDDDDDFVEMGMEPDTSTSHERRAGEPFQFEILTTDQIVQHMVDCIKEVNTVIQVTVFLP